MIIQVEAVECGAAALGIILAYFGRYVPLEELRVRCGVSRDGSKASNMVKVARQYGLSAKGFSKEPHDLQVLPLPMIVFWNFNHFVVVEGFGRECVYLNDPATGPRQVSPAEFDESFTGVVLLFEKTGAFTPSDARPSLVKRYRSYLSGSRDVIFFIAIASVVVMCTGLIIPTFSRIFIDDILVSRTDPWLQPLLLGMGFTAIIRGAANQLQQYLLMRFETMITLSSTCTFIRHIFKLPIEFYLQRHPGDISNRIVINSHVAQQLAGSIPANLLNLLLIISYMVLMYRYDTYMTLAGGTVAMLNIGLLLIVARKNAGSSQKMLLAQSTLLSSTMSGLQLIENLKVTGREDDFFAKWSGLYAKVLAVKQRLANVSLALNTLLPLLNSVNMVVILGMGSSRIMDGRMTIGMLVAFQSLTASFMGQVNQLVSLGVTLEKINGNVNRLDDLLQYQPDRLLDQGYVHLNQRQDVQVGSKLSGAVELDHVTFGYNRLQPPLIEDFCLSLRPGMRVALVGGSGSGKSTIAKIIAGLLEPWSGDVRFDGVPRSGISREIISNSMSMVDQELYFFRGSIRDNLTLWDEKISEDVLVAAATDACIHEVIASRALGYDSEVDEAGRNFSGGQLQRLDIARALSINPTILVLDEATSALDTTTELIVENFIRRRGCSCVVIAHRLSTIRDCDEIIVLDGGRVVERGTHEELKAVGGHYAELLSTR